MDRERDSKSGSCEFCKIKVGGPVPEGTPEGPRTGTCHHMVVALPEIFPTDGVRGQNHVCGGVITPSTLFAGGAW
jgi:hypothetical protein